MYKIITGRIIELLEKGIVPWRIPWTKSGAPRNLISGRAYRSVNTMLLASLGYERNIFLTSKQLKEVDGAIMAEEKPHVVMYWNNGDGKQDANGAAQDKKGSMLRYYTVFNIAQCVGIAADKAPLIDNTPAPVFSCESIVENMLQKPEIVYESPEAFYDIMQDYVSIPTQKGFASDAAYYCELFHQLAHSTGHHTRLNRMGLAQMSECGGNEYSLEELIADMATGYLLSLTGTADPFKVSKQYIKGWVGRFKSDSHLIINAASQAQQAVDFILNVTPEEKDQDEE